MKKVYCILLFCVLYFSSFNCSSQTRYIDSLKKVLKNEEEDTDKVNTLNTLSDKLEKISKYDSSLMYAQAALELAESLHFENGRANAYYRFGVCFIGKSNLSPALINFQKSDSIYQYTGNKKGISKSLICIGQVYYYQGNYAQSLEYEYKALKVTEETGDKSMSASAYGFIGTIYHFQNKDTAALELYFKAIGSYHKAGDWENEVRLLGNVGLIYQSLKKDTMALKYSFVALDIARKNGVRGGEAVILDNIGDIYSDLKQYDTALEYVLNSLTISKEIGYKRLYGAVLGDIGHLYTVKGKYYLSKIYLDSAIAFLKQIGDKEAIKATYVYCIALDSATADYRAEMKDYKNFDIYRDSLNDEKTSQEMIGHEYDLRQDSARVKQVEKDAIKENEIKNQKRIRNYTLGGLAVVLFFLVFVFIQRNRIAKEKNISEKERQRSDGLLLNILPAEVAEELKETGSAKAKRFDEVTVLFTDFKGFTTISEKLQPEELVAEIDYCFKGFDNIIHKYNIEKIKTIGDSYMAAGGLPVPNKTHAKDVVSAALEMVKFMEENKQQRLKEGKEIFEVRVGINSGPVVAGIVGVKKFAYDIWGDTVNLASRMESSGEPGKVNISGSTYELVKNDFTCTYRGKIQAKNKGEVDMYFVS